MVLNAQQKVKEKVLEKVIAQDQFSDGFKNLRDFFNKSKETDEIATFVEEVLITSYTDLKKTRSKNGTKNIPFIECGKKLIGYDFTDFMIHTLTKPPYKGHTMVSDNLIKDILSSLKSPKYTPAKLHNSNVEFDLSKDILKVKNLDMYDDSLEISESDFLEPFSNDTYYINNIRKLFLMFVKENNNQIPFVKHHNYVYLERDLRRLFVDKEEFVQGYQKTKIITREDRTGSAMDYNFNVFLWQFYKNLEKFEKNNSDKINIYLALNNKKLTLECGSDDDYILISTIDKLEIGYRKILTDYIWKDKSINYLKEFFINRIISDFENYLNNILESNYNLEHVFKREVPLSILSDSQILKSIENRYVDERRIDLNILKEIKDNCHDPKHFSRLMNLIEENL
jgi:hypothetical protein